MALCTKKCFSAGLAFYVTYIITFSLLFCSASLAQSYDKKIFNFLSPYPDSRFNKFETNIIIRFADKSRYSNSFNESLISVIGNKSGKHEGRFILPNDNETIIFDPYNDFLPGEIVTVKLIEPEKKAEKRNSLYEYRFEIQKVDLNKSRKTDINDYSLTPTYYRQNKQEFFDTTLSEIPGLPKKYLPDDFPDIRIYKNNESSPGVFAFSPFKINDFSSSYIILVDEHGIPLFYRKTPSTVLDFKKQRTGAYTYFDGATSQYYVLNEELTIIDSLYMQNGYSTDLHELEILKNGHSLMMSYDYQPYPLDTVFVNGRSDAIVIGLVIQELDPDKNVVFQWRSWDHFKLTDVVDSYNTTDSVVDYVHGNAIEVDYDGNILISSRHLDEITKIDRQTGEIIWRLGGVNCKNNEFNFINDTIGFSHQHDIRRLPNGHITLFDNGNLHNPQFSRSVEYELDEVNKTATLVWEYRNSPDIFAGFMGSSRRLDNKNSVIGWGGWMSSPAITEVNYSGDIVMQLSLPDSVINYRAFKFPVKSANLVSNPDSILYENYSIADSTMFTIQITNNTDSEIEINGFFALDSTFTLVTKLPVVLHASETKEFEMQFTPNQLSNYSGNIYLRSDSETEGIAIAIPVQAIYDSASTSVDLSGNKLNYSLAQNYPNPFNPSTTINFNIAENGLVKFEIYDILGSHIKTLVNQEMEAGNHTIMFHAGDFPSGVYFYTIRINEYSETKKMLLLR